MRSQSDGRLSTITQVKVFSPEIFIIARGQGFHALKPATMDSIRASVHVRAGV